MNGHEQRLAELVAEARRLTQTIGNQAAAHDAVFRDAYILGFGAGREVGYQQAHNDVERWWKHLAERIRKSANQPTNTELRERRYPAHTPAQLQKLRRWRGAA